MGGTFCALHRHSRKSVAVDENTSLIYFFYIYIFFYRSMEHLRTELRNRVKKEVAGCPWLSVSISPYGLCGRKATLNEQTCDLLASLGHSRVQSSCSVHVAQAQEKFLPRNFLSFAC